MPILGGAALGCPWLASGAVSMLSPSWAVRTRPAVSLCCEPMKRRWPPESMPTKSPGARFSRRNRSLPRMALPMFWPALGGWLALLGLGVADLAQVDVVTEGVARPAEVRRQFVPHPCHDQQLAWRLDGAERYLAEAVAERAGRREQSARI